MENLLSLSPLDGRYANNVESLRQYLSEYGLIKYRVEVEVKYLLALIELGLEGIPEMTDDAEEAILSLWENFSIEDAQDIKSHEKITNHDVKAVEYWIGEKLNEADLSRYIPWVHFGLTSQDINNTAIPMLLQDSIEDVVLESLMNVLAMMMELVEEWAHIPLLSRTHGQAATPTLLGKEINVFVERLTKGVDTISTVLYPAKFGGATGGFNAHHLAFPEVDWPAFADRFTQTLGLARNRYTTQVDHYDDLALLFDAFRRTNVILVDFCRDIWQYISLDYIKQKVVSGEVGSSTMPHKVNPIDFENAEGNLLIANSFFDFMSNKLPISRLQRDLSDSTVLRNLSLPIGHSLVAYKSILRGLKKLEVNVETIKLDLQNNYAVVSEGIQIVLRAANIPDAYERLKEITRGKAIDAQTMETFINGLDISSHLKTKLIKLRPHTYLPQLPIE